MEWQRLEGGGGKKMFVWQPRRNSRCFSKLSFLLLTQKSRVVKTDTSSLDVLLTPAVYSKSFRVEEGVQKAVRKSSKSSFSGSSITDLPQNFSLKAIVRRTISAWRSEGEKQTFIDLDDLCILWSSPRWGGRKEQKNWWPQKVFSDSSFTFLTSLRLRPRRSYLNI